MSAMETKVEGPFDRNRLWQTEPLAARIAKARVVMAGVGGLGWSMASALVGLGVRRFTLFDPDTLDITNLNRLFGVGQADVGRPKVDLLEARLLAIDPTIEVEKHQVAIPHPNLESALRRADVVFGGFDRPGPRLATNVLTRMYGVLYVDGGGAIRENEGLSSAFGQVLLLPVQAAGCLLCAGMRLDSPGYLSRGRTGPVGSASVLNGIIANLAVSAWLEEPDHARRARLLRFSFGRTGLSRTYLQPRPGCPLCGPGPQDASYLEVDLEALGLALSRRG